MNLLNKWVLNIDNSSDFAMLSRVYVYDGKYYKAVTWTKEELVFCEWQEEEFFDGYIDVTDICLEYLKRENIKINDFSQEDALKIFSILEHKK